MSENFTFWLGSRYARIATYWNNLSLLVGIKFAGKMVHSSMVARPVLGAWISRGTDMLPTPREGETMLARKVIPLRAGLLTAGAMLAMLALGPYASANPIRINFSGDAGSGYADLTIVSDPDASSNYDPTVVNPTGQPGKWDPEGAQLITGASGSFNGIAITGVKARNFANPPPPETLPKSYSTIGPSISFVASYDNLFYVNGSPVVCPPGTAHPNGYPFSGGFLDVYGVMFELDNGNLVGLWSDGVVPPGFSGTPGGLTYGLSVLTPTDSGYSISSSQFAGAMASVPEPKFMWLFGAVLLGLFAWRRSTE